MESNQLQLDEIQRILLALVESYDQVSWIRDITYNKQVYISPSYEKVWGRSCQSLYDNPDSWYDTLLPEDLERLKPSYEKRTSSKAKIFTWYRIVRPNGEIRLIKDHSFPILDNGKLTAFAGIAHDITSLAIYPSEDHTFISFEQKSNKPERTIKINDVALSRRELQCLYHLLRSRTAADIAERLSLSLRTVEYYIQNIKNKFSVRTLSELIIIAMRYNVESFYLS